MGEIVDLQPEDKTGHEDDEVAEDTDAGLGIAPLILPFNFHHELMLALILLLPLIERKG